MIVFVFIQEETSGIGGALLKPQPASPPPDMSPFFLRQYVKVSFKNCLERSLNCKNRLYFEINVMVI